METLHRDDLPSGGFAGVREHQLIKDPQAFGPNANASGSWPGIGRFVYLADARFIPHGSTGMHPHHEVDVISIIAAGRIAHAGTLQDGQQLNLGDVQVQRAGGEGFSHNEVNPDDDWNRMIQLWVLPEEPGQPAGYKLYHPDTGTLTPVYGGKDEQNNTYAANTLVSVALLESGQSIDVSGPVLGYVTQGSGLANGEVVSDGDVFRDVGLQFTAESKVQLIVIHTLN